jgi:asparagine synthase (glutamine-hydrolysing)
MAYYRGKAAPAPTVDAAPAQTLRTNIPNDRTELLNQMLRTGLVEGLPKWLPKADRLHLAHGLRFRSPFTDLDLIQDAFTIASHWKIHGLKEKYVLRKAMQSLLPKEVLNRPKFPQGMNYNLAFSNVLENMLQTVFSTQTIQARGFFRVADIDRLRRRPAGKAYSSEQAMRLWTAMLTEIWAQIFVDRRGAPVPTATS